MGKRNTQSSNKILLGLVAVLTAITLVWFLRETYVVSMPLVFAFFLAAAVRPVQHRLNRKLPAKFHWVGTLAAMGVIAMVVVLAVLLVYAIVATLVIQGPSYGERLAENWRSLNAWLARHGLEVRQEFFNSARLIGLLTALLPRVWESLFLLALVFLFALMMLVESAQWTHKSDITLDHSMPINETIEDVAWRVRKYLSSVTLVSIISGSAHGLFWLIMGVELWYIWALLMMIMNYIPNIGTLLAFIPPLLVMLAQHGLFWAFVLLGGMSVLETSLSYYMAPRIHGKGQSISALVVVVSVLFWGWVWGVIGAFLAVPLTVTLVAFFQRSPLFPIARLLTVTEEDLEETDESTDK